MKNANIGKKKSYHPGFKFGFILGILPQHELLLVPASTQHDWIHSTQKSLHGADWVIQNKLMLENAVLASKLEHVQLANKTLLVIIALQHFIRKNKKALKNQQLEVVGVVLRKMESLKKSLPLYRVVNLLGVTKKWYKNLKNNICVKSSTRFCLITNPKQLLPIEIEFLLEFYRNEKFRFFSNINIYYEMKLAGKANYSINTFYKLIRQQGLKRPPIKSRRRSKRVLKASSVLSVLHIDVTKQRCLNGEIGYLYVFKDNFSTYLLKVHCARVLRADIVVDCLEEINKKHHLSNLKSVQLITDGGSENVQIASWINGLKNSAIQHVIDKKDGLSFSNSMVEASNKLIKYRFLYHHALTDYATLEKLASQVADVLNNQRMSTIKGLTPYEKLSGLTHADVFDGIHHLVLKEDRLKQNAIVNGCHWINMKIPAECY